MKTTLVSTVTQMELLQDRETGENHDINHFHLAKFHRLSWIPLLVSKVSRKYTDLDLRCMGSMVLFMLRLYI